MMQTLISTGVLISGDNKCVKLRGNTAFALLPPRQNNVNSEAHLPIMELPLEITDTATELFRIK